MRSEKVQKLYSAFWFPINVCSHCGQDDDPESARGWPEDDDGDRICWNCFAEYAQAMHDIELSLNLGKLYGNSSTG